MPADLVQMLTPVATLVLGAGLARLADARKDSRAAEREREAAARVDARESRAFERDTLMELQHAVTRLGGGTNTVWSAAEREFARSSLWNVYLSGDGSEQQHEGYLAVRRLAAYTLDDAVRARARSFAELSLQVVKGTFGAADETEARTQALTARDAANAMMEELHDLIGERLRGVMQRGAAVERVGWREAGV